MNEVAGKGSSVLIENVSLVINVFNIGQGDFDQTSIQQGQSFRSAEQFLSNCLVKRGIGLPIDDRILDSSTRILDTSQKSESFKDQVQIPLGWIACHDGSVIPFGVHSVSAELPKFGEKKTWKEIRVCLPPSLFTDNETDLYCPAPSCREKLPKNKSMDSHIKKHLGIMFESSSTTHLNGIEGKLPCPLVYYCFEKSCQYNVESAEKCFKAYKNVKQHYIKVHAPRLFVCDMCQKTFSTLKVAETHKLMCGEKYSCSTCNASYNSLEALQTHCRRKLHVYDHVKYKDKRNFVKQEMSLRTVQSPPPPPVSATTTGRKVKPSRKLPIILPKVSANPSEEVFNTIQTFCRQAGVKVDYGCQTVCTAFLQKSNPVETVISSPTTPPFTHKKRKSTDTQTNIVKFRATCLDQRHNATNTNLDWKKVVTSDSQTQTAEDLGEISLKSSSHDTSLVNEEFATIKISESLPNTETDQSQVLLVENIKQEIFSVATGADDYSEEEEGDAEKAETKSITKDNADSSATKNSSTSSTPSEIKVDNGPSLHSEFISFLEATDSATQTDPDMFEKLGGPWLGINVNLDNISGIENNAYVSVSSTASQTAVESVALKSLSAEDYEALLNTTTEEKLSDLEAINNYFKSYDGKNPSNIPIAVANDHTFDWENLVEEVYWDVEESRWGPLDKNSQT